MALPDVLNTTSSIQRKITGFDLNDIKSLCIKHVPEWNQHSIQDLRVTRSNHGIMNYVFRASSIKDCVLTDVIFRIFDFDPKSTVDRQWEDRSFEMAGNLGIGPKIISRINALASNGCRIEEFIPNDPFNREGFFNPNNVANFGKCIGLFHTKMTNEFNHLNKSNELEKSLIGWFDEAKAFPEHVDIFDPVEIKTEIDAYLNELRKKAGSNNHAFNVVMSHNDILQFNILQRSDANEITIIDLELSGFNYAGYDIASFIGSSHLNFDSKEFPFIGIECEMNFPEHLLKSLITNYLTVSNVEFDDDFILDFVNDVKFLELGWWLNRILFIAIRSFKSHNQHVKECMAEFSRNIRKTYFYKKKYGIANKYFSL